MRRFSRSTNLTHWAKIYHNKFSRISQGRILTLFVFSKVKTVIHPRTDELKLIFVLIVTDLRKALRVVSSGIAASPSVVICLELQAFSI